MSPRSRTILSRTGGVAALLLLVGSAAAAPRQKLALDGVPKPPGLPASNAATELAGELTGEIEKIRARQATGDAAIIRRDAEAAWRRVAHELLIRGAGGSPPEHAAVVAGFRVADARDLFDAAVEKVRPGTPRAEAALEALKRFAASAPGTVRAARASNLALTAGSSLGAIQPLLAAADLPELKNHWPVLPGTAPPPTGTAPPANSAAPAADSPGATLAAAAADPDLPATIRERLTDLAEKVQAAEAFLELRSEAASLAAPLLPVALTASRIDHAGWLSRKLRDALLGQLADELAAYGEASTRAGAAPFIARLHRIGDLIATTTALADARGQTATKGPLDPTRIAKVMEHFAAAPADESQAGESASRAQMIERLLQTMLEARHHESGDIRKELRALEHDFVQQALKAEEPVLRQVETLAKPGASPTDPACSSLLESQRRRLRDLERLETTSRMLTSLEAQAPLRAAGVGGQAKRLLALLPDATRGADAAAAVDALLSQWSSYAPFPAEDDIRRGDPEAVALCAGRDHELLAEIDRRRDRWAEAWAKGDPDGPAAQQIAALYGLMDVIRDAQALEKAKQDPRRIGRWAGWEDIGGLPGATDAMPARIALAVDALARQDDATLRQAIDLLESETPLWRLRTHLIRVLSPLLEPLPDGLSGVLGKLTREPPAGAYLVKRRSDLTLLARYGREYLTAQRRHDEELEKSIAEFIRALSLDLLRESGVNPPKVAALRIFEGGSPPDPAKPGAKKKK